jgi:hypothetical protein
MIACTLHVGDLFIMSVSCILPEILLTAIVSGRLRRKPFAMAEQNLQKLRVIFGDDLSAIQQNLLTCV